MRSERLEKGQSKNVTTERSSLHRSYIYGLLSTALVTKLTNESKVAVCMLQNYRPQNSGQL